MPKTQDVGYCYKGMMVHFPRSLKWPPVFFMVHDFAPSIRSGSVSSFSGQMVLAPIFLWAFSTSWPTPSACGASLSQSAAIQIKSEIQSSSECKSGLSLVFHRKKCDSFAVAGSRAPKGLFLGDSRELRSEVLSNHRFLPCDSTDPGHASSSSERL